MESTERPKPKAIPNLAALMSNQQLPCPPGGEATFLTNAQRQLISKMRTLVAKHLDINNVPSFPELTGDIRLLRFLEG